MNLKEAYSILELSPDASPEEAKKKYKELTKKMHPDINKAPDAHETFVKINEAYQVVSSGKSTDQNIRSSHQGNPFGRQVVVNVSNISLQTTISFKESVFGCKKDLKFNRKVKCQECDGHGEKAINNGCEKCGGKGQVVARQGSVIMIQTCDKCFGRSEAISCSNCNETGMLEAEASVNVTIPGGIEDGNVLRLQGMGHFAGTFGPFDQHTDVHLRVTVQKDENLSLSGMDVIFNLEISLLNALQGCQKTVNTVLGKQDITIKPLSKNKEEVIIPKLGVNNIGNQRVILDVKYPDNIDKLISILNEET